MPRIRFRRILPAAVVAGLSATVAHACTVCDSPTGHPVRAGLFDGHFTHTLLLVAAPVPVFAAALLLLQFAAPDLNLASALPTSAEEYQASGEPA